MIVNPARTSHQSSWRRAMVTACALVLLSGGIVAGDEDLVVVRVFRLQFATATKVSVAIQPLLTDEGTVTVQPGKSLITVRDRADIVDRVGEVISVIDVKPESFRLRIGLLAGLNAAVSLPRGAEVDPRLKRMFPFDSFRALGAVLLEGEVGDDFAVDLEEGYRVRVRVRDHRVEDLPFGLPSKSLRLDLQPFVLERVRKGSVTEVLRTRVVLSVNQEVFIGAGETEGSERGLVLTVKALPGGSR